ncbi:hypothetical protein [Roseibium sp. M-1]
MNNQQAVARPAAPSFAAIALIDDGLQPMSFDLIPESEREAVFALLEDAEVLEDLAVRGLNPAAVEAAPDEAIEALTDPTMANGLAFAKISDVSATTQRMIERRQTMRAIAASIRNAGECEVIEFGPDDDLSEIARFDLVFIDYYLEDTAIDGSRAEQIAGQVQERRDHNRQQQIVLMSTIEGVRAMRSEFRRNARIEAASFAFVSKQDLDEDWKVKAHLEMLARGMQHSAALGDYISAVKASARNAAEALSTAIDDLDIGDFAYIQRIALHADGQPLGDYLSWLLSSHLTALAFESELRTQQAAVDKMEFEDGPLSPSEPSVAVASLYHNALFSRNLGALGGHPRAGDGSPIADVPFVQLGDVFLTDDRRRAVVVLSPDCDLAFSTHGRPPDRDLGVILLFGDPNSVTSAADKDANTSTEGMIDGSEVYRIDWRFNTFQTVPLGGLAKFLSEAGFDVSNRDRLRPIYSLKLQHELGNHLLRVGPPVMPPISRHAKSKIRYNSREGLKDVMLTTEEVVVSHFKNKNAVRLTPALVSKLKEACKDLLDHMQDQLDLMPESTDDEKKARRPLAAKVESLRGQISGSEVWPQLLGDQPLPADGECKRLRGSVYVAKSGGWVHPTSPAVVLVVGEEEEQLSAPAASASDPISGMSETTISVAAEISIEVVKPAAVTEASAAKSRKGNPEPRAD